MEDLLEQKFITSITLLPTSSHKFYTCRRPRVIALTTILGNMVFKTIGRAEIQGHVALIWCVRAKKGKIMFADAFHLLLQVGSKELFIFVNRCAPFNPQYNYMTIENI